MRLQDRGCLNQKQTRIEYQSARLETQLISTKIEINADIGEGWPDTDLAPWLDSCNIACGGHFGDENSMKSALKLAASHGIRAGAHPSWPDRVNFGRKSPSPGVISIDELRRSLKSQITGLLRCAAKSGLYLHHVKAHGALYHDTVNNRLLAEVFAEVVQQISNAFKTPLQIITMFDGALAEVCHERKIKILREVYADRAYMITPDGQHRLLPRSTDGSVISDPEKAALQAKNLVSRLPADTVCIHSDTPDASRIAAAVARGLGTRS
jgi:UPF0271 protein